MVITTGNLNMSADLIYLSPHHYKNDNNDKNNNHNNVFN